MGVEKKITTADVRAAMSKRFASPEWSIMWEVAPATGAVRGQMRYADAVMMSLWPSRGLDLRGVEIKISRADWMREAKNPEKAERIASYCDYWWVHVAPGVILDLSEVPMMWGVREFDGRKWRTLREAQRTEARPCDRAFLASLMRRNDEASRGIANRAVQEQREAIQAEVQKRVDERMKWSERELVDLRKRVADFEEASGIEISKGWNGTKETGLVVKAVMEAGVGTTYGALWSLRRQLNQAKDILDRALDAPEMSVLGVDQET